MGAIVATLVAGLGAAVISAFVSLLVARYTAKKGPNYENQLSELRGEIARLSTTHEGLLAHQVAVADDERQRRADAAWKPSRVYLTSDAAARSNVLTIIADKHFGVVSVDVMTTSGAVVATVAIDRTLNVRVLAGNYVISAESVLALINSDPDYRRFQKTTGKLRYQLSVGLLDQPVSFELPFRAIQDTSNNTVWTRLEG